MSDTIYSFPASVEQRAASDDLLELARTKGAADPTVFDEHPPYIWKAEISSTRIDSYYTRMQPSTLHNFADAANNGISFQNSHNTRELGLGYSLTGTYIGAQGDSVARVVADFYTIPGIQLGSVSTDNFIKGVRAGLIRDVSVGFYGGQYICSICGRDMMVDYQCTHFPGLKYEVADPSGENTMIGTRLCTAAIENASLAEVSAVFDGSTPSAMIQRANDAAREGLLNDRQVALIEQRYRVRLPEHRVSTSVPAIWTSTSNTDGTIRITSSTNATATDREHPNTDATTGDATITETPEEPASEPQTPLENDDMPPVENNEERTALLAERDELKSQLRAVQTENERLAPLTAELETLRARVLELQPLADDGKAYRENLIVDTLAEGVRAFGPDFDQEVYRGLLSNVPLATVKRMQADWRKAGDQLFPGGRKTVDGVQEAAQSNVETPEPKPNAIEKAVFGG